jgi:hypothetical protein
MSMITAPSSNAAPPASAHPHQSGTPHASRKPSTAPAWPAAPAASRSAAHRHISGTAPPASTHGRRRCRSRFGGGGSWRNCTPAQSQDVRSVPFLGRQMVYQSSIVEGAESPQLANHPGQMRFDSASQFLSPDKNLLCDRTRCRCVRNDALEDFCQVAYEADGTNCIAHRNHKSNGKARKAISMADSESLINFIPGNLVDLARIGSCIGPQQRQHSINLTLQCQQISTHQRCSRKSLLVPLRRSIRSVAPSDFYCPEQRPNGTDSSKYGTDSGDPIRHRPQEKPTSPFVHRSTSVSHPEPPGRIEKTTPGAQHRSVVIAGST